MDLNFSSSRSWLGKYFKFKGKLGCLGVWDVSDVMRLSIKRLCDVVWRGFASVQQDVMKPTDSPLLDVSLFPRNKSEFHLQSFSFSVRSMSERIKFLLRKFFSFQEDCQSFELRGSSSTFRKRKAFGSNVLSIISSLLNYPLANLHINWKICASISIQKQFLLPPHAAAKFDFRQKANPNITEIKQTEQRATNWKRETFDSAEAEGVNEHQPWTSTADAWITSFQ